jgi:hypothetical protein
VERCTGAPGAGATRGGPSPPLAVFSSSSILIRASARSVLG